MDPVYWIQGENLFGTVIFYFVLNPSKSTIISIWIKSDWFEMFLKHTKSIFIVTFETSLLTLRSIMVSQCSLCLWRKRSFFFILRFRVAQTVPMKYSVTSIVTVVRCVDGEISTVLNEILIWNNENTVQNQKCSICSHHLRIYVPTQWTETVTIELIM